VNAVPSSNLEPDTRRGDAARQALIGAGVELFGRRGLEGATTRELARVAGQNIAAIPYHFGSKEGLYLAVAEHLLDTVLQRNLGLIDEIEALLAGGRAKPAALLQALHALTMGLLTTFTRDETLAMSRIISREQIDPTMAFDLFYERAIGRAHRCVAGVLDQYSGLDSGPVDSVLRAHVLLGSLLGFRVAAATVLRRTGWERFGTKEVGHIERVACEHAEMYARALRRQAQRRSAPVAQVRRGKIKSR
jgi:AcrR family transcriptional regulator